MALAWNCTRVVPCRVEQFVAEELDVEQLGPLLLLHGGQLRVQQALDAAALRWICASCSPSGARVVAARRIDLFHAAAAGGWADAVARQGVLQGGGGLQDLPLGQL